MSNDIFQMVLESTRRTRTPFNISFHPDCTIVENQFLHKIKLFHVNLMKPFFFFPIIFQLVKWDQYNFSSAMGPAALELLSAGMDGYINQAERVEELFGKIWPPPNV